MVPDCVGEYMVFVSRAANLHMTTSNTLIGHGFDVFVQEKKKVNSGRWHFFPQKQRISWITSKGDISSEQKHHFGNNQGGSKSASQVDLKITSW